MPPQNQGFKPSQLTDEKPLALAPAVLLRSSQLADTVEASAGLCIISLPNFIFPSLSINEAEAVNAAVWMLPGGDSFSSMNIFSSYNNTARGWTNKPTEAFLSPGCHVERPQGSRGEGVLAAGRAAERRSPALGFLHRSRCDRLKQRP